MGATAGRISGQRAGRSFLLETFFRYGHSQVTNLATNFTGTGASGRNLRHLYPVTILAAMTMTLVYTTSHDLVSNI
jgi:hypothetical protein